VASQPTYSAIPPHTPASILFVRDFLSFAAIDDPSNRFKPGSKSVTLITYQEFQKIIIKDERT